MKERINILISVLWTLILLISPLAAEESGTVLQFMNINPDPVSSALGNSGEPLQRRAVSFYYNPAFSTEFLSGSGLYIDTPDIRSPNAGQKRPLLKSVNLSASFVKYYEDLNYASFFSTLVLRKVGTLGIGLIFSIYPNDIPETGLDVNDNYTMTGNMVNTGDYALVLNYARQISRDIGLGINIKGINEQLGDSAGKTLAFDLGALYNKELWGIGLAVKNMGLPVKYREETHNLPMEFELNAHYILKYSKFLIMPKDRILLSGKVKAGIETEMIAGTGIEYSFQDIVRLRTGYQIGGNDSGLKAGGGIQYKNMSVDYGIHFHSDLGIVHRIGLSVKLDNDKAGSPSKEDQVIFKTSDRGLEVGLQSDVLFDYNKAELRPEACEKLVQVADIIKQYPDSFIRIEGNTDNTGKKEQNLELSRKRALSVRECLFEFGIKKEKMIAVGLGDQNPLAANDTDANRQLNRRVDIILVKDEQQAGIGKAIMNLPKAERKKVEELYYFGLDSYYRENKAKAVKYWRQIKTDNRELQNLIEKKIQTTEQEILNSN